MPPLRRSGHGPRVKTVDLTLLFLAIIAACQVAIVIKLY